MKHCNPSSCCYWPWRDEFLGFLLWRWLGGQRTLSEANMRLQKHNPTMHRSTAQSQVSHFHSLLQVHFHHSHPVSSHLPSIFKPFHIFHFPATPPPPKCKSGEIEGVHDVCTLCQHMHLRQRWRRAGEGRPKGGRGLLTCQSVILFLRLRCAHQEGVFLLESSVMNRRLAPCLIKFQRSPISILPSKNVQHTSGFYWLVRADSAVQALPCKVCS